MKLTLRSILRLIESNGGPVGLDLAGADMSGLDLSPSRLSVLIPPQAEPSQLPSWVAENEHGQVCMNLSGAVLRHARMQGVDLRHAQLGGCDFRGADLRGIRLSECSARGTIFSGADLTEADFHLADLRGARFGGATLRNAKLTGADLRDAYLLDADLIGARVANTKFGTSLLQERRSDYFAFLKAWEYDNVPYKLARRYIESRDIYRHLKATLTTQGYAETAGVMHFREMRASKWSHYPSHAKASFSEDFPPETLGTVRRMVMIAYFYVRHALGFFGAQLVETTIGYGERPIRPVGVGIALTIVFCAIFWASGMISVAGGGAAGLSDSFVYSLGAFTTIGTFDYSPVGPVAKFLTELEAALGVVTFSLFLFALGVKMART